MYEKLIQSPNRPFAATPDPQFYFPNQSVEAARKTIERAVVRAEGPVAVLGGAGLGKSMLGRIIADDLEDRFDIVTLHAARLCSRQALLQSILFELELPYKDLSEGELRLSILDRLEPSDQFAPEGVLIIVDEAHTLPSKLLDELRLISNFTRNNQPRTRLVLIGNLRLEDIFAEPQMDSFNQRLAARCYLQPMLKQETQAFVSHQLAVAGIDAEQVITSDALAAVYTATEGIPRLVNQLMDQAVVVAATNRQNPIGASLIQDAWSDLQQLPAPWHATAESAMAIESAVEFGTLSDLPSEPVPSEPAAIESEEVNVIAFEPQAAEPIAPSADAVSARELASPEHQPEQNEDFSAAEQCTEILQTNNFFAAFTQPLESVDSGFSAEDGAQADVVSIESLVANEDGFFAGKPTDEKLLALQEEQAEYDSLGVWENDPPLEQVEVESSTAPSTSVSEPSNYTVHATADLFGVDFEEEVTIPVNLNVTEFPSQAEEVVSLDEGDTEGRCFPRSDEVDEVNSDNVAVHNQYNARILDEESYSPQLSPDASGEPSIDELGEVAESDLATPNWSNLEIADSNAAIQSFIPNDSLDNPAGSAADSDATNQRSSGNPLAEFASENDLDPADIEDYVAQIQRYAEAVRGIADEQVEVEEVINENLADEQFDEKVASGDNWQIDISTADLQNELAVQQDVEDLVSQLNFSAFAVEPFSVEQIEIDAPANQISEDRVPEDSVRSINEEVHMMHSPVGANQPEEQFQVSAEHDDDRDLLIIEDQIAPQQPIASEHDEPKKVAPYGQLFTKLRN